MSESDITLREWRARVTVESLAVVAGLSLLAGCVSSVAAGVGVAAGGALAIGNFQWLSRRISAALAEPAGRGRGASWGAGLGLRFAALAVACAVLFGSGWAHPVGVLLGLTVLPLDLIVRGLRAGREASGP